MLGGLLARVVTSPIARAAGGWLLGRVGNIAKKVFGGFSHKQSDQPNAFKAAMGGIGPLIQQSGLQDTFSNAMRRFGDTVQNKIANTSLAPIVEGQNIGQAFHRQMNNIFDYMRGGASASQNKDAYMSGPGDAVEKENTGATTTTTGTAAATGAGASSYSARDYY